MTENVSVGENLKENNDIKCFKENNAGTKLAAQQYVALHTAIILFKNKDGQFKRHRAHVCTKANFK